MRTKLKKLTSVCLALIMILSVLTVAPISVSAASGVQSKINTLVSVYGNGSYFTASGKACYLSDGSDCYLRNIPSRGGLPSGATVASYTGNGWSCWGFAHYAFYYIFGLKAENCQTASKAVVGDYLCMSSSYGSHYAIYISEDSSNYYVYDSNGDAAISNKVLYTHACSKSKWSINKIYHANNYDSINGTTTHTHNYNTYAYYGSSHPHYKYYKCSCGAVKVDYTQPTYVSSCDLCAGRITYDANGGILYSGTVASFDVNQINNERPADSIVIYTSVYGSKTSTNQYGEEYSFNANGEYVATRDYGDTNGLAIPTGGFVVSGHGNGMSKIDVIRDKMKYAYYNFNDKKLYLYSNKDDFNLDNKCLSTNNKYGTLPVPTYDGYIFEGWYSEKLAGGRVTSETTFTGATKLYAHWTKLSDLVNLGDVFYANIINYDNGMSVTGTSEGNVVSKSSENSEYQQWKFERQSDMSYKIINTATGLCLDVYNGSTSNYTNIWLYKDNGTIAQKWYIKKCGKGYVLTPRCATDSVLDLYNNSSEDGTNIHLFLFSGSSAQKYKISRVTDVNGDGNINVDDVSDVQKYLANLKSYTDKQNIIADIDMDGEVTIYDVTLIQKHLAGLAVIE